MKKYLLIIIPILLLVLVLTNCDSTKIEYPDETLYDVARKEIKTSTGKDQIYLIKWKDQYYYVEGKKEIKKVLSPFPIFPLAIRTCGYLWASFETESYYETDAIYRVIDKNVVTYKSDYLHVEINRDDRTYRNHALIVFPLPRDETIDEIFSKLKRPVVKEFKAKNHAEVRELLNKLLEDENVFCILDYKRYQRIEGYYKIYVPAASKEELTGWRLGEFRRELHNLYGQGWESGNSITIDALPINYDEESHTAELTCHGPFEVYKRIEKYPKSEFKESSYEWTLTYFIKAPSDEEGKR